MIWIAKILGQSRCLVNQEHYCLCNGDDPLLLFFICLSAGSRFKASVLPNKPLTPRVPTRPLPPLPHHLPLPHPHQPLPHQLPHLHLLLLQVRLLADCYALERNPVFLKGYCFLASPPRNDHQFIGQSFSFSLLTFTPLPLRQDATRCAGRAMLMVST